MRKRKRKRGMGPKKDEYDGEIEMAAKMSWRGGCDVMCRLGLLKICSGGRVMSWNDVFAKREKRAYDFENVEEVENRINSVMFSAFIRSVIRDCQCCQESVMMSIERVSA